MSMARIVRSGRSLALALIVAVLLVDSPVNGAQVQQDRVSLLAGEKRVAVLLINFTHQPSEPWTKDDVRDLYFGPSGSVASYYAELSEGQVSITGSVLGYLKIRANTNGCYIRDWAEAARKAARRDGVVLSAFTNIVYVFPYQRSCWWNGYAGDSLDGPEGRDSWINGLLTLYVAVHELGHNFGVGHASSLTCTNADGRVAFSGNCSTYEYGDPFSVMGYGGTRLMHSWHRFELGLLPDSEIQTISASGIYNLSPAEVGGDGPRMLRIPRPSGGYYFLEIRKPFGEFDDFGDGSPAVAGVSIRTASALTKANTKLLDTAPETCTFNDAPLPAGQTFSDPINRISITTIGIDSDGADVEIQFGSSPTSSLQAAGDTQIAAGDASPPTLVPRINVTQVTGKLAAVNWQAAEDDVGVDYYVVSVDGGEVGTTCDLMLRSVQLKDGRTYQVGVQAVDGAGNVGPTQTTSYTVPDFTSPTLPNQLSAKKRAASTTLRWIAGADNVAVANYRVLRNGQTIAELSPSARRYVDNTVAAGTTTYSVVAFDAARNASKPAKATVKR